MNSSLGKLLMCKGFVLFCFVFKFYIFEIESHSVAETSFELVIFCLSLSGTRIAGVYHRAWLLLFKSKCLRFITESGWDRIVLKFSS